MEDFNTQNLKQKTEQHQYPNNPEKDQMYVEQHPPNQNADRLFPGDQSERQIPRPMSPLTINTEMTSPCLPPDSHVQYQRHQSEETNMGMRQKCLPSPFFYSQMDGPLKSPGIFVPYSDEKTREKIESAIRDILSNREKETMMTPDVFPLQDPPKSKIKRQISTDSNESNDNRTQSYPSKRVNYSSGRCQGGNDQVDAVTTSTDRLRKDYEKFRQQSRMFASYQHMQNIQSSTLNLESEQRRTIQNIPQTPYTQNLQWVISDLNPNSIHDFVPATPTTTCTEKSYSSPNSTIKSSAAGRSPSKQSASNEDDAERTICISDFSREFQNESYPRDCIPTCTASTVSDLPHSRVTETGFVFPKQPVLTDPVIFSPRIASDKFRPSFRSTPLKPQQKDRDEETFFGSYSSPTKTAGASSASPVKHHEFVTQQSCCRHKASYSQNQQSPCNRFLEDNNSDSVFNSFNSSLSRSSSKSFQNDPVYREKAKDFIGETRDNRKDGGSESREERLMLMNDMLRSYSMIEFSPSKHDIDRVHERVRSIYRSISSPMEMKEILKNLLIEERMKEEFINEDVFDTSPSKRRIERGSKGYPSYLHDRSYGEGYEHPDARRRLFGEYHNPTRGKCPRREGSVIEETASDLTDILGRMYKQHVEELKDEMRERYHQADLDSHDRFSRLGFYQDPRVSPGRKQEDFSLSNPRPGTSSENVCGTPGCAHGESRISRDSTRKRKRGDIEVCVNCEDDEISKRSRGLQSALKKVEHSGGKNCSCANIERAILEMARNAYAKIRRMDSSEYSFDRFNNEASETREQIFDSVKVLCGIKSMCKYGRIIEDMYSGSVVFVLNCPNLLALDDLWKMYTSGELSRNLNDTFMNEKVKAKYACPTARLDVYISEDAYAKARKELSVEPKSSKMNTSLSKSDTEIASVCSSSKENYSRDLTPRKKVKPSALAIIHMRSQSAPSVNQSPSPSPSCLSPLSNSPFSKERKFSFSAFGDQSPRKVFQEIKTVSPTMKKVFDFDVNINTKSSPKRKTFGEIPPWENQKVESGSNPKRRVIRD